MQLSEHFSLEEATYSETATRLGLNNQPSMTQLENMKYVAAQLEKLRAITGPLRINSWLRLPDVNVAVGGSKVSAHMDGWAVDLSSKSLTPLELCQKAKTVFPKYDQIIHEFGRWTHISFSPETRKQDLTIFNPEKKYKVGLLTEKEYRKI